MKQKLLRSNNKQLLSYCRSIFWRLGSALLLLCLVFLFFAHLVAPTSSAIQASDFKAGRIIDDAVFYAKDSMDVPAIQKHLDKYAPACDTWGKRPIGYGRTLGGVAPDPRLPRAEFARLKRTQDGDQRYLDPPYFCINQYYENPTTHETLYDTKGVKKPGMLSTAEIIYQASQQYQINPMVLLTILKKESYVFTDTWPFKYDYNTVMGYGCPDNAPCDRDYFGLYNQIHHAARQFDLYKKNIYSYNYLPYTNNNILYSPNYACGSKNVYLENIATTSLYIYTPYTPNEAALKNYPGTAYCGAYGNRNFFMFFNEWFGSTWGEAKDLRVHRENQPAPGTQNPSTPSEPSPNTSAIVPDGLYTISSALRKNYNLDIDGNHQISGTNVQVFDTNSTDAQIFRLQRNPKTGLYLIKSHTGDFALDAFSAGSENRTNVWLFSTNYTCAQYWQLIKNADGSFSFRNSCSDKYLDVANASLEATTNVWLWQKNGTKAQAWFLKRLDQVGAPVIGGVIDDGFYSLASDLRPHYNLDLKWNLSRHGNNIWMYDHNDTTAQSFFFKRNPKNGYYRIFTHDQKFSLDAANFGTTNRTNVGVANIVDNCAQNWEAIFNVDGSFSFRNSCSDKYLDVADASLEATTNVWLWQKNGTKAQAWRLYHAN